MFRYILGKRIFTVIPDDVIQFHLGIIVDDISRCQGLPAIHPHVKRGIKPIGKSSVFGIQLIGRYSQIQHDSVHAGDTIFSEGLHCIHIIVANHGHFISKRLQSCGCCRDCCIILINAVEMSVFQAAAYFVGMSSST